MTPEVGIQCVLAGVFGLLFGSFLNVCIYRVPRYLSVALPRSFCPECGHPIAAYDNIPLLSYVLLRGRCRACKQAIGWRYPVVEITTAVAFALVAWRYGWTLTAAKWAFFESLMIALFWIDLEERLLPDELTLGGSLAGLLLATVIPVPGVLGYDSTVWHRILGSLCNAAFAGVAFAGALWLIGWLYPLANRTIGTLLGALKLPRLSEKMRRRGKLEYLGLGDVKLLLLLGIFLGLQGELIGLLIGSVGGSLISILFLILARKNPSSYQLPFGTFLCAGAALVPLALNT